MVAARRMLRGRFAGRTILMLAECMVALVLAGALWNPSTAWAAEAERIPMEVRETFTYTFTDTGDAHCVDVLQYDRAFFNSSGHTFEKYPWILSRRYRDPNLVGEIRDFNAHVDMENATVTLTYDRIGRAYNEGDFWIMHRSQAPRFVRDDEVVFEQENSVTNEFTLWETLNFKVTTLVQPPPGATNFTYDTAEKGVTWQTPGQLAALSGDGSPLLENRALFLFTFAMILIAGIGGIAALYLTGRRQMVPAVAVSQPVAPTLSGGAPLPSGSPTSPGPALGDVRTPGDAQAAGDTPDDVEIPSFCQYCGARLPVGEGGPSPSCPACGRRLQ